MVMVSEISCSELNSCNLETIKFSIELKTMNLNVLLNAREWTNYSPCVWM